MAIESAGSCPEQFGAHWTCI